MKKERELSKTWREEWTSYFGATPEFKDAQIATVAEHFFDAGVKRGSYNATKYLGRPQTAAQRAADTKRRKAAGK